MTVKQSDGNVGLMCEVRWLHWSGGRFKRPHIWYWPGKTGEDMLVGDLVTAPTGALAMVIDTTCVQAQVFWLSAPRFGAKGWIHPLSLDLVE